MRPNLIFYAGVALLFTHEMDAVMQAEWRLLFWLRALEDNAAYWWFLLLHVPLFFGFFVLAEHRNESLKNLFRLLVSGFLVVHALLHFGLSGSTDYQFSHWISNLLIYGAAVLGALHIFLTQFTKPA
ncbi:MAG: DUF6713 family protein [Pseudomonadota bacterium]